MPTCNEVKYAGFKFFWQSLIEKNPIINHVFLESTSFPA
jgi:hypothetical protein